MATYASLHNHTCYSNVKLIDSINTVEGLMDYAYELGLPAVALTDHECLTAHIRAIKYHKKKYVDSFLISYHLYFIPIFPVTTPIPP